MPANAGIQDAACVSGTAVLDSGVRRNDDPVFAVVNGFFWR